MLPTSALWRSWSPLEKVSYIAQLAAALALLPTTAFAWLSFREARLAREDQARYFEAEKAPLIELESLEVKDFMVIATIKNTGETKASDLSYWYNVTVYQKKCNLSGSGDAREMHAPTVERGQTVQFIVTDLADLSGCGLKPKKFQTRLGRSYMTSNDAPFIGILLVWRDIQGNERVRKYEAEIKQ